MPTAVPPRRPSRLNKWHVAGLIAGYAVVSGALLVVAVIKMTPPVAQPVEYETTGISPASTVYPKSR